MKYNTVQELCQAACNDDSNNCARAVIGCMRSCGISVVHVAEWSGLHAVYQRHIVHELWQASWLDQLGPGSGLPEVLDTGLGHLDPLVVLKVHHVALLLLPERPKLVLPLLPFVQGPLPRLLELGSWELRAEITNVYYYYYITRLLRS